MARVLFITPGAPAPDRNGLAMRAGVTADGLHRHHDLTVAVVRSPYDPTPLDWARRHSRSLVEMLCVDDPRSAMSWLTTERTRALAAAGLPTIARFRPPSLGEALSDAVGTDFDAVIVMGTFTAGVAIPLLDAGVPGILDAFDDDAATTASLAQLDPSYDEEVPRFAALQAQVFPWFDRVAFASIDDAVDPFVHVPNAVEVPPTWATTPIGTPLTLLFVGNPGYLPNADALERLEARILPAIRARGIDVRLRHPALTDDATACYAEAHLAVVPLRAGGGTRIKILEAFAHGCPVISTPTGASGLAVVPGEHLVVTADDEDDDAVVEAVVSLAADEERRRSLAEAGRAFVVRSHDRDEVGDRIAALVDDVIATRPAR